MKKFLIIFAALVTMSLSNTASARCRSPVDLGCGNWYIGGFGGYNWTAKNGWKIPKNPVPPSPTNPTPASTTFLPHFNLRQYKPGYLAGGSFGYRWKNGFRLEAEVSFRYNQRKHKHKNDSNHQATAYLANAIYQCKIEFIPIQFYFGGGLGYCNTYHKHHERSVDDRDGFAWQALGGLAYPICNKLDITVEYRYFMESQANFRNNSVQLGFRYYL